MLNKKSFWILFAILFIIATIFSIQNFDKTGDIIDLDIEMNRSEAVKSAKKLAKTNNWGPENPKTAISFSNDWSVQSYVELKGGGKQKFKNIIKESHYKPYKWKVRLFKENETNEASVFFTPKGEFYQFREKIPEKKKGPALNETEALNLIKEKIKKFNIDLSSYKLMEQSKEERPSKRIDYTFVYENQEKQVNDAKYRYKFVLSGNKLTEIRNYLKVPDGFYREYREMRSRNTTLSTISTVLAGILYLILGTLVVIFIYSKKNELKWKKPIIIGFSISFISMFLININRIPYIWNYYDTALSANVYILKYLLQSFVSFLGMGALISLTFVAAEVITRKAFKDKIQFLKIWSKDVGASDTVFKYTVLGLLFIVFFVAYQIILKMITGDISSWWSPSHSYIDPNILSSYLPWLAPIGRSLQAGFWEECVFRAIPIGGAVLLGKKFGRKKLWIIGAFILQALIFGAAHANYAQQPSYARVIELIIPSIIFGLLYFNFGLLPGIIMHFAYDAVLMNIPIFASSADGIFWSKIIATILILFPILFVIYRRLKFGKWYEIKDKDLNGAVKPEIQNQKTTSKIKKNKMPSNIKKIIFVLGIAGVLIWTYFSNFTIDIPGLNIKRDEAIKIAKKTLNKNDIKLSGEWRVFTKMTAENSRNDRFIWEEGGKKTYKKLIGDYLAAPMWTVRFARFVGNVKDRKEEYRVAISSDGKPIKIKHIIPEHWEGESLSEKEAREIAQNKIKEKYGLSINDLEEVAAVPRKRPNRKDWYFEYKNEQIYPLEKGQARIAITISGNKVTDSQKYVFIPEKWKRSYRNEENMKSVFRTISMIIFGLLIISALWIGVKKWKNDEINKKLLIKSSIFIFILLMGNMLLSLPATLFYFDTAVPYIVQLFTVNAMSVIGFIIFSLMIGLIISYIFKWQSEEVMQGKFKTIFLGLSVSGITVGLATLADKITPKVIPQWADYSNINSYFSLGNNIVGTLLGYIFMTIILYYVVLVFEHITSNWTKRKILGMLFYLVIGFAMKGMQGFETIISFVGGGLIIGILLLIFSLLVFRYNTSLIPFATLGFTIINSLKQGLYQGYSGIFINSLITILFTIIIVYYFSNKWFFNKE